MTRAPRRRASRSDRCLFTGSRDDAHKTPREWRHACPRLLSHSSASSLCELCLWCLQELVVWVRGFRNQLITVGANWCALCMCGRVFYLSQTHMLSLSCAEVSVLSLKFLFRFVQSTCWSICRFWVLCLSLEFLFRVVQSTCWSLCRF